MAVSLLFPYTSTSCEARASHDAEAQVHQKRKNKPKNKNTKPKQKRHSHMIMTLSIVLSCFERKPPAWCVTSSFSLCSLCSRVLLPSLGDYKNCVFQKIRQNGCPGRWEASRSISFDETSRIKSVWGRRRKVTFLCFLSSPRAGKTTPGSPKGCPKNL